MRLVASLLVLSMSTPAFAGGIGPLVMGGFHTEEVYFYSSTLDGAGNGARIADIDDFPQGSQTQLIGNGGAGLEVVLGDRDDLVQGVFRGYWMFDAPQTDPAGSALLGDAIIDDEVLVANVRQGLRHVGVATVGMNFGVVRAAKDRFKFSVAVNVGAGFATPDHGEFLLAQVGGNINYLISRTLEFFVDASYGLRVRKTLSHGLYGTAGIRVMFD